MILKKIIKNLDIQDYSWLTPPKMDKDIYICSLLHKSTTLETNCLYIVSKAQAAKIRTDKNCTVLICSDSSNAFKLLKVVNKILIDNNILTKNMYQLMQVLYENKGIQHLIESAYSILDNPIILVDTNYKILATCQNTVADRPDLETQNVIGYMTDENIEAMKKDRVYEIARENEFPYYNKAAGAKYGWVTALINIHGIESAQMGVMEYKHPITNNDLELINFLCRLVSLELQKSDFYRSNQSLMHSFFLSELLDNHIRDIKTINSRIQHLNWKVTKYMFIMTISEQQADIFDKKAQLISKQLHQLIPNSRWVIYDGRIVFLICLPDPQGSIFQANGKLAKYLNINKLTAAVSRCFHSFLNVHKYYQESLTTHTMGQRINPDDHLYFYTDYICQHIGDIISKNYKLKDFYHPVIPQIQEYDKEHKTNLLGTLKEYLTYPDNPTLVSQHLYIHKNTLFYRMARLKELFPINLSNGEEHLKIHLTLKFMELE